MIELSPREQILILGQGMALDETRNETCYFCNGGQNKDKGTLSITRVNNLTVKYLCHRVKCGKRGSIFLKGGHGEETSKQEYKFQPQHFQGQVTGLELSDFEYLESKYGLDLNNVIKAGWLRPANQSNGFSLLMPVFSPLGAQRGMVLRTEYADKPKYVRSFKAVDEPWLCWYRTSFSQIVLVEDQISALKAATFATTVALLGAELTPEKMDEILSHAKGKIWLALDRDANKKTFDYLKRYRAYCNGNFQAHLLSKDIKNMSYTSIGKLLGAN
jgi:hypothetical protein